MKARRVGLAQHHTARSRTRRSVSHFWIFEIFSKGFSKYHHIDSKSHRNRSFWKSKKLFDSTQYHTARSRTRHSIAPRRVRLGAVLDNFGFSDISLSRLAQCDTVWSRTRRSMILLGVRLSAVSHCAESCFSRISLQKRKRNQFRLFIRDPDGLD